MQPSGPRLCVLISEVCNQSSIYLFFNKQHEKKQLPEPHQYSRQWPTKCSLPKYGKHQNTQQQNMPCDSKRSSRATLLKENHKPLCLTTHMPRQVLHPPYSYQLVLNLKGKAFTFPLLTKNSPAPSHRHHGRPSVHVYQTCQNLLGLRWGASTASLSQDVPVQMPRCAFVWLSSGGSNSAPAKSEKHINPR